MKCIAYLKILENQLGDTGGYTGTDRSLLTGHNTLLLLQITRDLLHASPLGHHHFGTAFDPINSSTNRPKLFIDLPARVDNTLIECELSMQPDKGWS